LTYPPQEQFANLPLIHFYGQISPDYFIVFGPIREKVEENLERVKNQGIHYQLVKVIDIFWDNMTRPEIFYHSFQPIKKFDHQWEAVYVYRHVMSPEPAVQDSPQ
jgi:hypothetical protein